MRILHVYRTYFPDSQGGLEEVIRQICLNSRAHGADSRVLSLSRSAQPQIVDREEGLVYRAHLTAEIASCGLSWEAVKTFRELLAWADLVHYHFPWPFADLLHLTSNVTQPTILTYHSDIVRQRLLGKLYSPLMKRFLRSVDEIVCTSPNYFATSEVLRNYSEKTKIIPIGLNEDSYPSISQAQLDKTQQEYGSEFFLFVGVLRYYKGLHILLDAIKGADYSVVIAGSGPIERELKAQAQQLELKNVIFAGSVDEPTKVALFKLARAVVFPSYLRSEAFGVTLLEGAMYETPLISTEVGSGTSHVNVDGKTGLIVPPGSVPALRDAMDQLHQRPDMAKLMGKRARKRFEQLFSGRLMGARYSERYQKLLGIPPQHGIPVSDDQVVRLPSPQDQLLP